MVLIDKQPYQLLMQPRIATTRQRFADQCTTALPYRIVEPFDVIGG